MHGENCSDKMSNRIKFLTQNAFPRPISENPLDDTLCVEVWDFDPAETVGEKFGKFFDVKGVKGMRRLVKEIAVAATTGQHRNELVGRTLVPLKVVPRRHQT